MTKRNLSVDLARDIRNPNIVIEITKNTAKQQKVEPGFYTPTQFRQATSTKGNK